MTTTNHYKESWRLYKTHSDFFEYDYQYYLNFSNGKKTLEAFAGYGRLSNFLASKKINLHVNELSKDLATYISVPSDKIHIGSFLDFSSEQKFERIIIAYNSFCLITSENDARALFSKIESLLMPGGLVSLSYYHPDKWPDSNVYEFNFEGDIVKYHSDYDLDLRKEKKGIWIDIYTYKEKTYKHKYDVRIYEDQNDLLNIISHTKLQLKDQILNYNDSRITEEGWIEYILELPS